MKKAAFITLGGITLAFIAWYFYYSAGFEGIILSDNETKNIITSISTDPKIVDSLEIKGEKAESPKKTVKAMFPVVLKAIQKEMAWQYYNKKRKGVEGSNLKLYSFPSFLTKVSNDPKDAKLSQALVYLTLQELQKAKKILSFEVKSKQNSEDFDVIFTLL